MLLCRVSILHYSVRIRPQNPICNQFCFQIVIKTPLDRHPKWYRFWLNRLSNWTLLLIWSSFWYQNSITKPNLNRNRRFDENRIQISLCNGILIPNCYQSPIGDSKSMKIQNFIFEIFRDWIFMKMWFISIARSQKKFKKSTWDQFSVLKLNLRSKLDPIFTKSAL